VWVGWLPTYRINPRTLDLQAFDYTRIADVGMTNLDDIAVDPTSGAVYLSGSGTDGFATTARIVRYDPVHDALAPYLEDSSYSSIGSLVVDGHGSIAALANVGDQSLLMRIDPGTPPDEHALYDPASTTLADVALDGDGSYLVIDSFFGSAPIVYDVDRDTGDRTTLVADLRVPFPAAFSWKELETDASGDLYVLPGGPGLGRIHRATPTAGDALVPITSGGFGGFVDLALVGGSTVPEPGGLAAAVAAAGALVAVARRRRRSRRARGILGP
jgi:hypothetical protein